jgi:hypothetical protein
VVHKYGRPPDDWDRLRETGEGFLIERARLGRDTSYTEMNTVLVGRTGLAGFDFDLERDRAAMGHLLGLIVKQNRPVTERMISALVLYLNENDAGPGFYALARELHELRKGATKQQKWEFWVAEVGLVHDYYRSH